MSAFSGAVVVKPLATGQYLSDGELKTVYAEAMMPDDERLHALNAVPFIVQERLHARRHLRVVTVGHRSWVAALRVDASAPADWRQNAANHSSFVEVNDEAPGVRRSAMAVARDLGLGYTSQDWIEEGDGGTFLVDVNPAGQWLFLPEAIGVAVSEAIADLLLAVP
jgi:glutathione synthase/RimK-type ligase-like ATP-grasp enzyme